MKTRDVLILSHMFSQITEYRHTFITAPTFNANSMRLTAVNAFPTCFFVSSDKRMLNFGFCEFSTPTIRAAKVFFRFFRFVAAPGPVYKLGREYSRV